MESVASCTVNNETSKLATVDVLESSLVTTQGRASESTGANTGKPFLILAEGSVGLGV